jgi:CRP-like cAMP-binding protein
MRGLRELRTLSSVVYSPALIVTLLTPRGRPVLENHSTVGQIAEFCGAEPWQVRRAVDALPTPFARIGTYRVVRRDQLPAVLAELQRRGWLTSGEEVAHAP